MRLLDSVKKFPFSILIFCVSCSYTSLFCTSLMHAQIPTQLHKDASSVPTYGKIVQSLAPFDQMMREFVHAHNVPGASLAVAKQGRLVYARSFGWADIDLQQPVQPTTRFRIASLSKPITAAAVLTLVRDKQLRFDSTFVDLLNSESSEFRAGDLDRRDARLEQITIADLLRHRAGWDRDESFDPMFRAIRIGKHFGKSGPADITDTIRFMLEQPLDFAPGERYAYSNFGYCLLGRVIEASSQKTYEQYVQEQVFKPLGVSSATLGRSISTAPNEAKYYTPRPDLVDGVVPGTLGTRVARQYGGWIIENMDAHGGWIATAEDLVRFAHAFDDDSPILPPKILRAAFQPLPSEKSEDVFYGYGWSVRQRKDGSINTWHTGALSGTSTLLVRRHDGLTWAVLFNARHSPAKKQLANLIDPLLHQAADAVQQWP